jgi:hypothetical protein
MPLLYVTDLAEVGIRGNTKDSNSASFRSLDRNNNRNKIKYVEQKMEGRGTSPKERSSAYLRQFWLLERGSWDGSGEIANTGRVCVGSDHVL